MRKAPGMPAPLTSHQRNLFMAKRRGGSSQEAAAAAAGISVRSARRIERNQLQPQSNQPRDRNRPDPLAGVWEEEELVPLLRRAPALTPITLLEHLQQQKPDVDWIPLQRTLQRRVREWKALHGNGSFSADITRRYHALCSHYGLAYSRNNLGGPMRTAVCNAPMAISSGGSSRRCCYAVAAISRRWRPIRPSWPP